jgi:hypothetical protein
VNTTSKANQLERKVTDIQRDIGWCDNGINSLYGRLCLIESIPRRRLAFDLAAPGLAAWGESLWMG